MGVDSIIGSLPLLLGVLAGVLVFAAGAYAARRALRRAREGARRILADARQEAESRAKEALVSAQEKLLAVEDESDRRERELDAREVQIDARQRRMEQDALALERKSQEVERRRLALTRAEEDVRAAREAAQANLEQARGVLERNAGLSASEARAEIIATVEAEARKEATRLARRIEDEARDNAERDAVKLMVQATQRVSLREVVETTVSLIQLPNDEIKGRIIGREGRNIRSLEMTTGIDLIVDDTPHAILISSFDPLRREVARVAIDRLVEDGRIHPARIEEVVARVQTEIQTLVEEAGTQAAFHLGITDLHPRLSRLVGRLRFHTSHGQNLLQHCLEVALIASHMAAEVGGREDEVRRAGLLHEVARGEEAVKGHVALASAELAGKLGESERVVHAIQSLHPGVEPTTLEALLLATANRISDARPGARKDNLEVFVERLRRLEGIASGFPGVVGSYAVKAGKELRVIVDAKLLKDEDAYALSKEIARTLERDVAYTGQIKVSVVRETRAVQFAV